MGLNWATMILKELLILCVCGAAINVAAPISLRAENKIPDDCKTGGFFIGCQAYTFNRFTVFEAIEKTAQAGGKVIEFYPGQKLSKEEPNVNWDHNASAETIEKVKDKLAACKVKAVNYGVVGIPKDEAEARKIFEFAKTMGLYAVTTESVGRASTPSRSWSRNTTSRSASTTTRSSANNPNYRVWDPNYVLSVVKDRDARDRVVRRHRPLGPLWPEPGGMPAHSQGADHQQPPEGSERNGPRRA